MAGLLYTCVAAVMGTQIPTLIVAGFLIYAVVNPRSSSYKKEQLQQLYAQRDTLSQYPPRPPQQVVEDVRAQMRRQLTARERRLYRLFTLDGTLHPKYDILYHIATIEELIKAEMNGALLKPSDAPGKMFLFTKSKGLVATCFEDHYKISESDKQISRQTVSELDVKYKAMAIDQPLGPEDMHSILDQVAVTFLHWRARQAGLLYYGRVNCVSPEELYNYY